MQRIATFASAGLLQIRRNIGFIIPRASFRTVFYEATVYISHAACSYSLHYDVITPDVTWNDGQICLLATARINIIAIGEHHIRFCQQQHYRPRQPTAFWVSADNAHGVGLH